MSLNLQRIPKPAIRHSRCAISRPWLGPLGPVPSASGANAHILEHGPSLAFPTNRLDALNLVLIDAEGAKYCCGACRLLLSAVGAVVDNASSVFGTSSCFERRGSTRVRMKLS